MTALEKQLGDYLALRRSMGFKLRRDEKLLLQFVDYCASIGARVITNQVALDWAMLPEGASEFWVGFRLAIVRGFARHLRLIDERTELIPTDLVPCRARRATPFLYTEDQVRAMMAAARSFRSPIRRAVFETILGLLWATGMRIGEALALDRGDVDLAHGILTVREAKFGKSRELPVHETTAIALTTYAKHRDRLCPEVATTAFFVSAAGTRVRYDNFHLGFKELVRRAGIEARSASCRPRPHDLRHSFAVRTLIGWYRDGLDAESRLPKLSTYLGHVDPANTYWYLSAAPELLALAAERLERATETEARP